PHRMPESTSPHVVVLDGSPVYAEVYRGLFAFEGYRTTTLSDCAADPATVLGLAPDLIVLDLRCGGGLRGLDSLRRLRRDPAGGAVPVLASKPGALIDTERYGAELRALGAAVFDGFAVTQDLLAAATAAAQARGAPPAARPARDTLRAVRKRTA